MRSNIDLTFQSIDRSPSADHKFSIRRRTQFSIRYLFTRAVEFTSPHKIYIAT
jgi:hypothetical protein